jgi:hypothetical protein
MAGGLRRAGGPPDGFDASTLPAPSEGTPIATDEVVVVRGGPHGAGGMGMAANPLVERFEAVTAFAALTEEAAARLRTDLYDSGTAAAVLARWVGVLEGGASAMVDQATIKSEAEVIAGFIAPS